MSRGNRACRTCRWGCHKDASRLRLSTSNKENKKHLKNVGPIRHCEPPNAACFTLPFTRCRYCRTPPAHLCPQQHRQQQQQRQRVTEGTTMASWNGPNDDDDDTTRKPLSWNLRYVCSERTWASGCWSQYIIRYQNQRSFLVSALSLWHTEGSLKSVIAVYSRSQLCICCQKTDPLDYCVALFAWSYF